MDGPTSADWLGEVDDPGASYGVAVESAGDVNGDGFSDFIVGAEDYSQGQGGEGGAFVYYGLEDEPTAVSFQNVSARSTTPKITIVVILLIGLSVVTSMFRRRSKASDF